MVQPGNPYQGPEYGGQQSWGQQQPPSDPWGQPAAPGGWQEPGQGGWQDQGQGGWGQPTAPQQTPPQQPAWSPDPGYGPAPDPWNQAPVSAAPTSGWPGQGYPPPPPPKSNTGLILGLVGGGVVVLLLVVVGLVLLFGQEDRKPPVANPGGGSSASPSDSAEPSPTPTEKDPESLDSKDTDTTSLTTRAIFGDSSFTGDNDETYSLVGTREASACTDVGGGKMKDLMKKYDCGRMVVGVYLNEQEDLFSAVVVVPLESKDDAESAHSDILADKQKYIDVLVYYCPSTGKPGAKLCKRSSDNLPTWYASFTAFHRYLLVAISLYTDGHRSDDVDEIDDMTTETVGHITEVLLRTD
ncbi:MAG: hypothetical protein ACRDTM_03150 [Micromonosporaceae bacterium]